MKYVVWYKKIIEAKDQKQAMNKEGKIQASFHSMEQLEEEPEEIGFKY